MRLILTSAIYVVYKQHICFLLSAYGTIDLYCAVLLASGYLELFSMIKVLKVAQQCTHYTDDLYHMHDILFRIVVMWNLSYRHPQDHMKCPD